MKMAPAPPGDGLRKVFVQTEASRTAFLRIDELRADGWQSGFCQALLLLGPARSGKTHMVRKYLEQRFPRWDKNSDGVGPVVMLEVPSGCTLKTVATELLMKLNDPAPDYGSMTAKMQRAVKAMEGKVQLVVIDEVQRLIDADTEKVNQKVAGWLTDLLNRQVAPLLLVGEEKARQVFQANHLYGRTRGEVTVSAYDWSVDSEKKAFATILYQIETAMGLPGPACLRRLEMAHLVHQYSQGLLGLAVRLIGGARTVAARENATCLLPWHLEHAADEFAMTGDRQQVNPFRAAREAATR